MFADDLAYENPVVSKQDKMDLDRDLERLSMKYRELELSLNAKKSKLILLTPSNNHHDMDVSIGGEKIEQVDKIRYLGIDLDPKLSYKNHAAKITTKCRQAIEALCKTIRKWAPRIALEKIYKSTIEPMMMYAIEAWYPSQKTLQNSVERVQKFAAKLCFNNFNFPYPMVLEKLG
jgi:hypothetical protein